MCSTQLTDPGTAGFEQFWHKPFCLCRNCHLRCRETRSLMSCSMVRFFKFRKNETPRKRKCRTVKRFALDVGEDGQPAWKDFSTRAPKPGQSRKSQNLRGRPKSKKTDYPAYGTELQSIRGFSCRSASLDFSCEGEIVRVAQRWTSRATKKSLARSSAIRC